VLLALRELKVQRATLVLLELLVPLERKVLRVTKESRAFKVQPVPLVPLVLLVLLELLAPRDRREIQARFS